MIPSPDMAAVAILAADVELRKVHQGRVSTDLQPGGPAIRVTLMPGGDPVTRWEWQATIQADCYALDQIDAANLAALVRSRWTDYTGRDLPDLDGYVSGCWVVADPMWVGDPDTKLARYSLMLGIAVHGR